MDNPRILIVDDDPSIRKALRAALATLQLEPHEARTGEDALEVTRWEHFDVVLLDVNMPGMGGLEACRRLRERSATLVLIMLTVDDKEDHKVAALESGADDYVTKPFAVRELAARIRANVRRARTIPQVDEGTISIGEIELDRTRHTVKKAGTPIHLTPKEFDLLRHLMDHAGRPVTHTKLLHTVWGPEHGGELEYLRTFVRTLRKKLERDPAQPEYLLTETGIGYRFSDT